MKRLRNAREGYVGLHKEAADEIERLRKERDEAQAALRDVVRVAFPEWREKHAAAIAATSQ